MSRTRLWLWELFAFLLGLLIGACLGWVAYDIRCDL
jgi:hypothetical protein